MAYETGSVATSAALNTVIETFATGNGFTLNAGAGSWLSKGQSHVKLNRSIGIITSITRSGTTATVNFSTKHGQNIGDTITISGATDALYNGTFTILSGGFTNFSFTCTLTGTPAASPATGTLLVEANNTSTISAANSSDGTVELCPYVRSIYIVNSSWPITYYLFYSSIPDQIVCVLQYETNKIQVIIFGDIVKINTAAYVGGNWFFASRTVNMADNSNVNSITDTTISCTNGATGTTSGNVIPFTQSSSFQASSIHCKIDSNIWGTSGGALPITFTDYTISEIFRSPNSWNSQTHLVPMHLQRNMASSLFGYIGFIEHLRLVRIDNYELGDIIILGSDKWKVFPWLLKSTVDRNGSNSNLNSGTLGFAVRYDGP